MGIAEYSQWPQSLELWVEYDSPGMLSNEDHLV